MLKLKFLIIFKTITVVIKKDSPKTEKRLVMKKSYSINIENPCTCLIEYAWTKSCPQTEDRQTDRRTDKQTVGQTDRVIPLVVGDGV